MTVTNGLPTASAVSRAIRRDFQIISQPIHKGGYVVRRGNGRQIAANIWVAVSDLDSANVRKAGQLAEIMRAAGYDIHHVDGSTIIYVHSIPSAADAAPKIAAYLES
ncbi:hypothetical protein Jolie1_097 [Mycobacterium phage Julie1]|jgi:hypothetical protein|uniref:Uncharacterized protein n=1 Tax=Mycobacterium phage Julie1 TaxID=1463812 RepID=W8EBA7_9CAUD|nr:hypothetical protein CG90_gp97 [Mycobacterium phage Julie1]AHJ88597.1 hypothetical protein Jolie1_097 [Mycobacterium phage Julie1]